METKEEILKKHPCNRVLKGGKEYWGRHTLLKIMEECSSEDWRMIENEKPEYYSNNLVIDKEGRIYCAHRVSDGDECYYVITGTDNLIEEITHWKPLPKRPLNHLE